MTRPSNALIVDDEAHVRAFLRLILKELEIENVWEASDGAQALATISMHKPELVLLDLNLPVVGGMEVLKQLQVMQPDTPVVVVSAQSAMKSVVDTAQFGAIGYVLKHGSKDEILAGIRSALENRDDTADRETSV